MLGGFITPAGCTGLKLESSMFHALAVTSFLFPFWLGPCGVVYYYKARTRGETVVPVSYPGRGSMRIPSVALLDPFLSFSFLFSFYFHNI